MPTRKIFRLEILIETLNTNGTLKKLDGELGPHFAGLARNTEKGERAGFLTEGDKHVVVCTREDMVPSVRSILSSSNCRIIEERKKKGSVPAATA